MNTVTMDSHRVPAGPHPSPAQAAEPADAAGIDPRGRLVVRSHEEVRRIAADTETYSSHVSRFLQVPNGLDGEEHRHVRALLDPLFSPAEMERLRPVLERIAADLVSELTPGARLCAVEDLGSVYAVRAQCAWLGWDPGIEGELLEWMRDNHEATRSGELARTAEVASRFEGIVRRQIRAARQSIAPTVTARLLGLRSGDGRGLKEAEVVSILRNVTGGDLGSLALCAGVLCQWLAERPEQQDAWRPLDNGALDAAIDEVLRIDDPFTFNRRAATCPVEVAGHRLETGDQVVLDWTSANRDPGVFKDPDAFEPERNAASNLVYGVGPHVCPGRPLATLELRVLLRALLERFALAPGPEAPVREQWPLGGWQTVPLALSAR